ncbi:MAG: GerAB/ArcD/ProY family transporter [Oscillospiraceae bacterium]|nr:GerAB/ArcD/ProY family transporter [Oscillospiraceae bacterium]
MIRTQKINAAQLTALLVLSRIYSIFSYSPSISKNFDGSVLLLALPISFVLTCLIAVPCFYFTKNRTDLCLYQQLHTAFPKFGKAFGIFMGLVFLYICCETVSQFEYFMTTVAFPSKGNLIFLILLTVTACYFALMGIEPIARSCWILAFFVGASLVFLALCLVRDIDLVNICSPFLNGVKPVFSSACIICFHNLELIALFSLLPNLNTDVKKTVLGYNLISLIIFEIMDILILCVLSDYAHTRTLPVFTLANAASVSFMQSMDAFYNSLWTFIALTRTSLYLFLAAKTFSLCLGWHYKKVSVPVCSISAAVLGILLAKYIELFSFTYSLIASGVFTAIILLVLPTFAATANTLQRIRQGRTEA